MKISRKILAVIACTTLLFGMSINADEDPRKHKVRVYGEDKRASAEQRRSAVSEQQREARREMMTERLMARSQKSFTTLDANENGILELGEILSEATSEDRKVDRGRQEVIRRYFASRRTEIDRFEIGDADEDRSLSREEFENLDRRVYEHVLEQSFQRLDENGDAVLDQTEFNASAEQWVKRMLTRRDEEGVRERRRQQRERDALERTQSE